MFYRDSAPGGGSDDAPKVSRVTCTGGAIVASPRDGIDRIACTGPATTTPICGR